MSRKKITAVVPIRKGSQRILDKNFRTLKIPIGKEEYN